MPDTPEFPPPAQPDEIGRRYEFDEDGNLSGVVLTVKVDSYTEFVCEAIPFPRPDAPPAAP